MFAVNALTDLNFVTEQKKNTILIAGPLRISIFVHLKKINNFFLEGLRHRMSSLFFLYNRVAIL